MSGNRWRRLEVGLTALKLGVSSFGGPIAHIGYFRQEYVVRKKWLSEQSFGDLAALCQFLPGPASSQLGIAIGIQRAGLLGGMFAWLGFTLPSALLLIAFAYGLQWGGIVDSGWLTGLQLAAVAVVAQAVWSMAHVHAPDKPRIAIAALSSCCAILIPGTAGQIVPIVASGVAGAFLLKPQAVGSSNEQHPNVKAATAIIFLAGFFILLILLPILSAMNHDPLWQLADIGYRAGALVFGGGHVVLPMLEHHVIAMGIVNEQQFMAGYGAAQAVPGPLFTFAAYLGAVSSSGIEGLIRATVMLMFIFLPSYLLVAGVLPFWSRLRNRTRIRAALNGVNASVVGILFAALYDPVWTSSVNDKLDFIFVVIGFVLLVVWKCPPWLLVFLAAASGWLL
ncbi:chromate efflux transporter [Cohnella cholangitidis]|uniref:Chromate efflux transporter n=1 Tax=Cohnella cholangitidis TaxID=2598458 RepID=A0A7G5C5W2_9BACL|nr:chromate efflux transporter [Cohnella cholangitidis]QMV44596.1 chromate efflux transporter [Cohnella cholangitidis]